MAMVAPVVTRAQAAKISKAVGGSKTSTTAKKTAAQRNSKFATKQNAKRQKARVAAAGAISQQKVASNAAVQQQRVQAANQIAQNKAAIQSQSKPVRSKIRPSVYGTAKSVDKKFSSAGTISVTKAAKPVVNPLLLIIFTWGAIVLLYVLISSPKDTSTFMSHTRSYIGLIYSTNPMFKVAQGVS